MRHRPHAIDLPAWNFIIGISDRINLIKHFYSNRAIINQIKHFYSNRAISYVLTKKLLAYTERAAWISE